MFDGGSFEGIRRLGSEANTARTAAQKMGTTRSRSFALRASLLVPRALSIIAEALLEKPLRPIIAFGLAWLLSGIHL